MMAIRIEPSTSHLPNLPTPMRIRPMRLEDLEQVHAIDQMSFSIPWPENSYRYELLDNPRSMQLVMETDAPDGPRQVVAVIVVWLIEDEAHIATLSVHPDYRGQGISRELLAATLIEAIHLGMRTATLEVRANNLVAQALYRRFHFNVYGRRPRYYRDNDEDALIMTVEGLDGDYLKWLESGSWRNIISSNEEV
jgi:[ribosomal protein S18]-alanine N-acetyltransferase